jgi:ribose-phosphate pyrophosphokinase
MNLKLFAGSANPVLAEVVARGLGTPLGACATERFPDGELRLEIKESVRGDDVYLIQPTCPPVADHLLDLLLLADACRRAGADVLTAVMPYYGYARQDRRAKGREPIGARLIADLVQVSGIQRVVLVDLHTPASEAFFGVPVEHLSAVPLLANAVRPLISADAIVVAPDLGAVRLAEGYAGLLGLPQATVYKIRQGPEAVQVREIVGDVRGRAPVIVDDMISTGHTVAVAVRALLAAGSKPDVTVVISHGLFVGPIERVLRDLPIGRLVTTDTVPPHVDLPLPVEVATVAPLLVEAIRRLHRDESLSELVVHR